METSDSLCERIALELRDGLDHLTGEPNQGLVIRVHLVLLEDVLLPSEADVKLKHDLNVTVSRGNMVDRNEGVFRAETKLLKVWTKWSICI